MLEDLIEIFPGNKISILVTSQINRVIKELSENRKSIFNKLLKQVETLGNRGMIMNTEHFRNVQYKNYMNLWEFKPGKYRFFCFFDINRKKRAVICDFYKKQSQKIPLNILNRAYNRVKIIEEALNEKR